MKTIEQMLFPHEEALRAIFANQKMNSAQEGLKHILANQHKLTRDQQQILREGLAVLETSRLNRVPHASRLPNARLTTEARDRLLDETMATALLADLADPYWERGRLGAAGPEAERYAHSYIPLTMDARDYFWGDEDIELINHKRKEKLAELDDEEIERIMNEHKEMIAVLYENPDVAQYYPCVPSTEEGKEMYPLEEALKNTDEWHKQLWSKIRELRQRGCPSRC